jgi:hypothetical protein
MGPEDLHDHNSFSQDTEATGSRTTLPESLEVSDSPVPLLFGFCFYKNGNSFLK